MTHPTTEQWLWDIRTTYDSIRQDQWPDEDGVRYACVELEEAESRDDAIRKDERVKVLKQASGNLIKVAHKDPKWALDVLAEMVCDVYPSANGE